MDRIFLRNLEKCESQNEILKVIEDIDDDEIAKQMKEDFEQILSVNQNENVKNIINILEYKYRKIFQ